MTLPFPPKPGIYKFDRQENGGKSRIHLRLEEDFSGVLVVNAAKMIHLNPTAGLMAWQFLSGINFKDVPKQITSLFITNRKQATLDYQDTVSKIEQLISDDANACPVCDLGLESMVPFSAKLSAPYRMDLALTYRCNNNCSHCYNAREKLSRTGYPKLETNHRQALGDWYPPSRFHGGEPTMRADLPELVRYAELKVLSLV